MKPDAQLVTRNSRLELYQANQLRAYVEDDELFGIDKDGYAVHIGTIEHRSEVIMKWQSWLNGSTR